MAGLLGLGTLTNWVNTQLLGGVTGSFKPPKGGDLVDATVIGQAASFHPLSVWIFVLGLGLFALLTILVLGFMLNTSAWRQTQMRKFEDEIREVKDQVNTKVDKVMEDFRKAVESHLRVIEDQSKKDLFQTVSEGQRGLVGLTKEQ